MIIPVGKLALVVAVVANLVVIAAKVRAIWRQLMEWGAEGEEQRLAQLVAARRRRRFQRHPDLRIEAYHERRAAAIRAQLARLYARAALRSPTPAAYRPRRRRLRGAGTTPGDPAADRMRRTP